MNADPGRTSAIYALLTERNRRRRRTLVVRRILARWNRTVGYLVSALDWQPTHRMVDGRMIAVWNDLPATAERDIARALHRIGNFVCRHGLAADITHEFGTQPNPTAALARDLAASLSHGTDADAGALAARLASDPLLRREAREACQQLRGAADNCLKRKYLSQNTVKPEPIPPVSDRSVPNSGCESHQEKKGPKRRGRPKLTDKERAKRIKDYEDYKASNSSMKTYIQDRGFPGMSVDAAKNYLNLCRKSRVCHKKQPVKTSESFPRTNERLPPQAGQVLSAESIQREVNCVRDCRNNSRIDRHSMRGYR